MKCRSSSVTSSGASTVAAMRERISSIVALAIVVAVLAVALIGDRWHATLEALGAPSNRGRSLRWFFTGQIGKYAPGGVWHVVGQGELARRGGIPRRTAYASVMICTVVLVGAAALTVAVGAAIPRQSATPWWAVGLGAGIVAAIAYDPDGCQVWIIDDGVEGYSSPRFDPKTGLPVCDGKYPPGTVLGVYETPDAGMIDRVSGPATKHTN